MIAAVIAVLLVQAETPDAAAFGQRMWDSAAAAERLQGPLDGHWTLKTTKGQTLYEVQIADPPNGATPPQGAWRNPATEAIGPLETVSLSGDRLVITFAAGPSEVRLRLTHGAGDLWRGWMTSSSGHQAVHLIRNPAAGSAAP